MNTLRYWLPAFAGMACLALGAGLIGVYGFFVEPLSQEFGVGVAVLNLGPVGLLLVPGFVAPFVGRMADRVPLHQLMLLGVTIAMVSLLVVSQMPQLWMAAVAFLFFVLGLTMYGPVVVNGLMVKVYVGQEARALAIAAMGISFASATLPPSAGFLLANMDWRQALVVFAVTLMIALWIVIWIAVPRNVIKPEAGESTALGKELFRQSPFWLIGFCVALGLTAAIILAISYPPHFVSRGFSVAQAGGFLAMGGAAGLIGKACIAWQGDAARRYAKWLAIILLVLQAIGLSVLVYADSAAVTIIGMLIAGFGGGAFIPMQPYLNSQYYKAGVIGQVNGAQMPIFLPFGIVGAPLAGYVYDQTGSYETVLLALVVVMLIAAGVAMKLPDPQKSNYT